ncbi:YggT family protein [bacterium]|nr:YggT family protein [bacterium]
MGIILYRSIAYLFNITLLILVISCFLTWIPNIDWYRQPYRFFYQFSNFFFSPFRKIIPPIYGIDFSPIVAFILLNVLENVILGIIRTFLL